MDRNRAGAQGGLRSPKSGRILPWPTSFEQTGDGFGKSLPNRTPLAELALAALGDRINAPPSPGIGRHPTTGKQARLLETMQHRVDRPLREVERAGAPALEFLDG